MNYKKTERGFRYIEFNDLYGEKCSIQKSSLATDDAIWIGIDDANPQVMASKTAKGGTGWVPYKIPDDVLLSTRMHINREQAESIVDILNHFIECGELPTSKDSTHNTTQAKISSNIIESDNLCDYCSEPPESDRCHSCNSKQMYNNFIGRKLSALC